MGKKKGINIYFHKRRRKKKKQIRIPYIAEKDSKRQVNNKTS